MKQAIEAGTDVRFVCDVYHNCGVCNGQMIEKGTVGKVTRTSYSWDDFVAVDIPGGLCDGFRIDREYIESMKEAVK